jgi:kelch-like protein 19
VVCQICFNCNGFNLFAKIFLIIGRLIALGGYNGTDFVSTVESYNTESEEWIIVGNMTSERSGHGAAITIDFVH